MGADSDRASRRSHSLGLGEGAKALKVYFDSSALVKLLLAEPGSEWARGLWRDFKLKSTCRLSYVETRAAVASALRSRRINQPTRDAALNELEVLWDEIDVIEVDSTLVRIAGDIADRNALRGYEAVQLAAAHRIRSANEDDVVMATWDDELTAAAFTTGISVVRTDV